MRRPALAVLGLLASAALSASGPRILLVARDLEEHPLSGLRFAYGGVESQETSPAGATELELPAARREGEQIKIQLLPAAKRAADWFLVNAQINIPSGSVPAEVVLMRRSAFRKLAESARDAARPTAGSRELAAEDRKRALVEAAARYGLRAEQLETALQSFAETKDTTDRGIAAYLAGRYRQAEELLVGAADKKESDLVGTYRYLGAAQYEQARYTAAATSFRKALGLRDGDPSLLSLLGISLFQLAQWTEAEPLMRRALATDERNVGPDHSDVARDLSNLAALLQATNRFAEAEPLMRRALAIDERSVGPDHAAVATDLNNLALLLEETNRLAEAERLMRRALAIDERIFGPDHPNVALRLNNLAQLLQATNRLAEAEPLMARATKTFEGSLGEHHPNVAGALDSLSQLLKATSRFAEAEPLIRRALAIDERSFGPDHPNVASRLNTLAQLLKATNRFAEAEPLIRRALAIDEKSFGRDHPDVARDLHNLAGLLQATNRLVEAELLMRWSLAIDESSFGPDNPKVAIRLNNLATLLYATNRLAEAEPLMRRALAIDERSFGPNHPEVATDLNNLAALLQLTNRLAEAELLMRCHVVILLDFNRRAGHEHPRLQAGLANYRELLRSMGKSPAEIEAAIRKLVRTPE